MQCTQCGNELTGDKRKLYCSKACKYKGWYLRARKLAPDTNAYVTKTCPECGLEFSRNTRLGKTIYCSDHCCHRVHARQRRARKKAAITPNERVLLVDLIKRDKGI